MNLKSLLLASSAFFVGVAGANAADAIVYVEPAPIIAAAPAFSWTGAYVGGQVGWGWAKSSYDVEGYKIGHMKPDGFLGGLYAGYNFDLGNNFILGVDGDITFNNQKDSILNRLLRGRTA